MGITAVTYKPEGYSATFTRKGSRIIRNYSLTALLQTASGTPMRPTQIYTDAMCPKVGDVLDDDEGAYLRDIEISLNSNGPRPVWQAKLDYSSDTENNPVSPIYPMTSAKISYPSWERIDIPIRKDLEDKPVVNTAGDPPDPPLTVSLGIPIKLIRVNLSTSDFSPDMLETFFDAVNEDTYDGWAAGKVIVDDISAEPATWTNSDNDEISYWEVTIKLAYNKLGWQPELMSQGYRELYEDPDDAGNFLKRPIMIQGQQVQAPVPLDENGVGLVGEAVEDTHFEKFTTKNSVSFAALIF